MIAAGAEIAVLVLTFGWAVDGGDVWHASGLNGARIGTSSRADIKKLYRTARFAPGDEESSRPRLSVQAAKTPFGTSQLLFDCDRAGKLLSIVIVPPLPVGVEEFKNLYRDAIVISYSLKACSDDEAKGRLVEDRDGSVRYLVAPRSGVFGKVDQDVVVWIGITGGPPDRVMTCD